MKPSGQSPSWLTIAGHEAGAGGGGGWAVVSLMNCKQLRIKDDGTQLEPLLLYLQEQKLQTLVTELVTAAGPEMPENKIMCENTTRIILPFMIFPELSSVQTSKPESTEAPETKPAQVSTSSSRNETEDPFVIEFGRKFALVILTTGTPDPDNVVSAS
jgi:hypothetical protein